jgi:glucose/arabinose dehydrogenase
MVCKTGDSFSSTMCARRSPVAALPLFRFLVPLNFFLFGLALWLPLGSVWAATLPAGFSETLIAGNLASPTAFAIAPDGRIFVCQQTGQLRVIKNGSLLATPFVSLMVDSNGERGLLGVAFDPNFATNQFVYVYYTVPGSPAHNRVSRFTANGDVAAGGETIILELNNLSGATNHNGGALHFGLDGKLYIAVGDNANSSNAQTLGNLHGKMLRINANGSIPTDNPFFNSATGNNRAIWTLGLRNPFTFNVQPNTGRIFINDVGQVTWEEVNEGAAGRNFGWPTCEGACNPPNSNFVDPVYYYSNDANTCAITGGTFYNPATGQFPTQYVGKYFLAEFCGNWIKYIDPNSPPGVGGATSFATGLSSPVDLQVGANGSLYYLQRGGGGQLWRIDYTAAQAPMITQHPTSQTVSVGQSATFSCAASGTPPLSYQWRRNNANISGATGTSYTFNNAQLSDSGARFRCYVSNASGNALSNEATLTVVSNQAPTATITTPAAGTLYSGGQVINFAGTGTDPEQGNLPASVFTWRVDFHHDAHVHPFIQPFSGTTNSSFTPATTGHTETNVWYRIYLTVTDANGQSHIVFRDIFPRIVTITLASNPSGLQLTLDGQPIRAPYSTQGVVGVERMLGVTSPQTLNGTNYSFVRWSDNGAATHTIATPSTSTVYQAFFALPSGVVRARKSDFDEDGRTDFAVWRPSEGNWYLIDSATGGTRGRQWGLTNDLIVPGDYDGDGKTDFAVWRPSEGNWYVIRSSTGAVSTQQWSLNGDVPVPGDYDGDGKTDFAVWRPSEGNWYVIYSSTGAVSTQQWGLNGDVPVPGDYDGDGKTDFAVWRPNGGNWYVIRSSTGNHSVQQWGLNGDLPVSGDYDGDNEADLAVWRPSEGNWYVIRSSTGAVSTQQWGLNGDVPVPGDYDGDGRLDFAVWRPPNGVWYVINSSNSQVRLQQWGLNGDVPVSAEEP